MGGRHFGEPVIDGTRDVLAHIRRRPVGEQLRRRANGGRRELAAIHFGENQAVIEQAGPQRRPLLDDGPRRRPVDKLGDLLGVVDLDDAGKLVTPHEVDKRAGQRVEMDIDGVQAVPPN